VSPAGSYGALFFLQRKYGKIPWGVVLAMIGIIIGAVQEAMGWSVQLATIKSRYGELEMSLVQAPDLFTKGINAGFSEWRGVAGPLARSPPRMLTCGVDAPFPARCPLLASCLPVCRRVGAHHPGVILNRAGGGP